MSVSNQLTMKSVLSFCKAEGLINEMHLYEIQRTLCGQNCEAGLSEK